MSSDVKVTVASNYLVGVVTTEDLLLLLVASPLPVALLVPLFLPVQLCTPFPSPLVVRLGVPPAKLAPARLNWVVAQLSYEPSLHFSLFSWRSRIA